MKNCFRRGYGPRLYMLAGAALWVVLAQPARAVDEIQVYNAGIAARLTHPVAPDSSLPPWQRLLTLTIPGY